MGETFDATPADPHCEKCGQSRSKHYRDYGLFCRDSIAQGQGGWVNYRRCIEHMPRLGLAPHPDVSLGWYRHHKGGEYEVIGGALMASNNSDEVFVLYRSIEHGYCAARTVSDFIGLSPDDRRRFERIGKEA